MRDYWTLEELKAKGFDLADLPPAYLTALDGEPCWDRSELDHLLGPADED